MNDWPRLRRLIALTLPLLLCGCVAYRPRMFSYETGAPENPGVALPAAQPARISVATGRVLLQEGEGRPWREVQSGDPISVGGMLRTGDDSEAIVELPDGHGQVKVAQNSCVEVARLDPRLGTLLVLSAGKVTGSISGADLEVVSSCGGGLSLHPNDGATAPFEFRHGRDAEYVAVLISLGRSPDWALFHSPPTPPYDFGEGLTHRSAIAFGEMTAVIPEPETWALFLAGGTALGLSLRKRR